MRLILPIAIAALTAGSPWPIPAAAQVPDTAPEVGSVSASDGLAAALLSTVESGARIALRPLRAPDSNLAGNVAGDLHDAILDALFRASAGRYAIMTRERLEQVYGACQDVFTCGEAAPRLADAEVDVEIQCTSSPGALSVNLFCSAVSVETTATVGRGHGAFPIARTAPALEWSDAMAGLSVELSRSVSAPGVLQSVRLIDQRTGTQTQLAALLANKLRFELGRRMSQRRGEIVNAADARRQLGYENDALPAFPRYAVHGVIWSAGPDRLTLAVELGHDGRTVALEKTDIARSSLSSELRLRSPEPHGLIDATAEARLSDRLDVRAAQRAAINLARARLIAQATDTRGPPVSRIANESDAALALESSLEQGLPYDETVEILNPVEPGGVMTVHLTGRVAPLGGEFAPRIEARLGQTVYRAGEPITITLSGSPGATIGVFAWGADGRIVRVYPAAGIPAPLLTSGSEFRLPAPSEDRDIQSAPVTLEDFDNQEDHEILLIIAVDGPMDFTALAPSLGSEAEEYRADTRGDAAFFQALTKLDLSRLSVVALPYQIRE